LLRAHDGMSKVLGPDHPMTCEVSKALDDCKVVVNPSISGLLRFLLSKAVQR
jgi:hypothetical protein